jgi:hypothetical protein
MEFTDILSMVGMYVLMQILVCGAHMFAYFMDSVLYETNKYNENRNIRKIGTKWLFWRCKKDDKKEIFTIAFVHEIISAVLFLAVTIMFILTLILNEQMIMFISFVPIIIYFLYSSIRKDILFKKTKTEHR